MIKKLRKFDDDLKEKLKDKEFRRYFDEEGRKLEIGYKIAKLRDQLGLSQAQLAEKIDTSQTVISRLESGNYWQCSLRTLEKIALATGTHLNISFRK
jgi:ribosome-binding protein aMBF1 (putative translation factor)